MLRSNTTILPSSVTIIGVLLSGSLSNALSQGREKHGHSANSVAARSPFSPPRLLSEEQEAKERL